MTQSSTAALKRERTKRLARLGAKVYMLRKRGKEQEMYDLVCNEFVSLGGVYIKFLQGVLFNTPVMKRWHSPNRLRIFENVDTEPLDVVQILRAELSPAQLQHIVLVQPQPFAAGSFGQVYLAQHANGRQIIIKVLRPMVREMLRFDLRLLSMFSKRFAAKEYSNFTIKMDGALKEFRQATMNETDYVAEANFAHELFLAYEHNPDFVIPETYLDLCTPHLIVQDYVDGISGAELLKIKEQGGDPAAYLREKNGSDLYKQLETMGVECLVSAFRLPRVQGDPHPGNLRFMADNKIGMIDFGISAPAPDNRAAFFGILNQWNEMYGNGTVGALFEQFMRFFVNDLYRALKKLSSLVPQSIMPQAMQADADNGRTRGGDLMKEIGHVVQDLFDSATGTRDVRTILNSGRMLQAFGQLVNRGNRLGLVINLESSEMLRAAQTFISVLEGMGMRAELLPRILGKTVAVVEAEYPEIVNQTDMPPSMHQAIAIVNRWLERVAVRDPALFTQLVGKINARETAALQAMSMPSAPMHVPPTQERKDAP